MTTFEPPQPSVIDFVPPYAEDTTRRTPQFLQRVGSMVARLAGAARERLDNGPAGSALTISSQNASKGFAQAYFNERRQRKT